MSTDGDSLAAEVVGRRRRLTIIVGVGLVIVAASVLSNVYAERRVSEENRRVERVSETVAISDSDIINYAYGSGSIGAKFAVADDRVTMTNVGGGWCVAIRSEYLRSSRVSSFLIGANALKPTEHC